MNEGRKVWILRESRATWFTRMIREPTEPLDRPLCTRNCVSGQVSGCVRARVAANK